YYPAYPDQLEHTTVLAQKAPYHLYIESTAEYLKAQSRYSAPLKKATLSRKNRSPH
ncbi:MAG: hypothetical protein RLY27_1204, partial [Pseudomonadota bacterium]